MTAAPLRGLVRIPVAEIRPHPANVRADVGDVSELAASIREHGLLAPLVVEDLGDGYLLLAGHRRLKAAQRLGLEAVPCIVRPPADRASHLALMLVENLHRADLNPIDQAHAVAALKAMGRTQAEVAKMVGKSGAWVSQRVALLELPEEEQLAVAAGERPVHQVWDQVMARRRAERDGRKLERGWHEPHFTDKHPQARRARKLCDGSGHSQRRLGKVACERCWEAAIRADERKRVAS